ncbi:2-phospho-L-lactate guanylyltransferase [Cellulomonas massiliensis]|uniref:2-phospho-L-lactate guanylyltransferase n=1 Tax=Cellulomonas massiliensis TaxID=1465811 RepID=UPI0002DD27F0|nr:2-phospho-L-lactate guanylyltransferase [Cellulomonas massiliensis]
MTRWWVVVPVKEAARGKSRLAGVLPDDDRTALVRAMALDTLAAVRGARSVAGVVLVCSDEALARVAADDTATAPLVVVDDPAAGLDAAVLAGAHEARRRAPGCPLAVVLGDLPLLTPEGVEEVLDRAAPHERAHVPDAAGTGTTVLTALTSLRPSFGSGSSARHAAAGHVPLTLPAGSGARHDVDVPDDLAWTRAHRPAPRTRRALTPSA